MNKEIIEAKISKFAKSISPNDTERSLVAKIYKSLNDVLGDNNILQIGSYPRFTAIRPLHDLDVLFILGEWEEDVSDPGESLDDLFFILQEEYENPTSYSIEFIKQSHSVSIIYKEDADELFAVDIIPAYVYSKNEFGQDKYRVPEIIKLSSINMRAKFYIELKESDIKMRWIESDPRGYIKIASDVDHQTKGMFRKSVKLVKFWAKNLIDLDETLKLKSFHLEQVITKLFVNSPELYIYDAIYDLFFSLPNLITEPYKFPDRANHENYIDDYISDFSNDQRMKIKAARDNFLIKLELLKPNSEISELFLVDFYYRKPSEEFLFDSKIKTLIDDDFIFEIDGHVKPLSGYPDGWIRTTPSLKKGLTRGTNTRRIEFSIRKNNANPDEVRWKVRNSDECEEPRGEITIGNTRNVPERTAYKGQHYVEAYAIRDNVCIAKSRIYVNVI